MSTINTFEFIARPLILVGVQYNRNWDVLKMRLYQYTIFRHLRYTRLRLFSPKLSTGLSEIVRNNLNSLTNVWSNQRRGSCWCQFRLVNINKIVTVSVNHCRFMTRQCKYLSSFCTTCWKLQFLITSWQSHTNITKHLQ